MTATALPRNHPFAHLQPGFQLVQRGRDQRGFGWTAPLAMLARGTMGARAANEEIRHTELSRRFLDIALDTGNARFQVGRRHPRFGEHVTMEEHQGSRDALAVETRRPEAQAFLTMVAGARQ